MRDDWTKEHIEDISKVVIFTYIVRMVKPRRMEGTLREAWVKEMHMKFVRKNCK
jgi:hypothetical protein